MKIETVIQADNDFINSRFNAHLTFNILNTLQYLILEDEKEEAYRLVNAYSRILRGMLVNESNETTIGSECDIIIDYLELERMRMDEKFSYKIDVKKEIKNILVPKSLLVSVIENAVKHGVKKLGNRAYVLIDSPLKDRKTIRIKNNTPENLYPKKHGYGLELTRSLIDRHNIMYGTNIGVENRSYLSKSDTGQRVFEVVLTF